jgi:DNA polymerase III epsilon subunit-like protein
MNGIIGILAIVVLAGFIIWQFIIRKNEEEDKEIVSKKYEPSPLPDFATKDPQTGELSMIFHFDESETNIGEYLFLDIETTGLPKVRDPKPEEFEYMPRIVQISWYLLDSSMKAVNVENCYLKQEAPIPKESIKIHGITDEIIVEKGEDANEVFDRFQLDIRKAKYVIAHNIEFDLPIIESEFLRLEVKKPFKGKIKLCTMKEGTRFCKIPSYSGRGYKYPKLEELLEHCYFPGWSNIRVTEAHNAQVDVAITIKCFIKLKELGYIKIDLSEN